METEEVKIQIPEGYEIDKEKSTFEFIRFKPIKKFITYEDVCNKIFKNGSVCFTSSLRRCILWYKLKIVHEMTKTTLLLKNNLKGY